jgi:hypothetical protein
MKLRAPILTLFIVAVSIQFSALGAVTRWTLSGVTFSDGGTAEGYLDLDPAGGAYGILKNWQISVSGGNTTQFPEFTYTAASSNGISYDAGESAPRIIVSDPSSNRELRLQPLDPPTDAGGTVGLNTDSGSVECYNCSPARVITAGSMVASTTTPNVTLFFPQFGNGGGLVSDLVLTNAAGAASLVRVEFRDDSGAPLSLGLGNVPTGVSAPSGPVSSLDFTLEPYGTARVSTDGLGNQALAGSAVVFSDQSIGGVVRFTIGGIGIAGVGSAAPMTQFIVPVRRQAGTINTGLALQNVEATSAQLEMTLLAGNGTTVPNGTVTIDNLAGSGHLSKFIDELFPDAATNDFEGSVRVVVTTGSVAATALELGSQPGRFTTLPVINLITQ